MTMQELKPLNFRDEKACLNIAKGMTQTDALIDAGFEPKWAATHTTRWLKRANVANRIRELKTLTTTRGLEDIERRKQILRAIQSEPHSHPPTARERVMAIAEQNKMEKVYEDQPMQDNRTVNVIVSSEREKELIDKLLTGGRDGQEGTGQVTDAEDEEA